MSRRRWGTRSRRRTRVTLVALIFLIGVSAWVVPRIPTLAHDRAAPPEVTVLSPSPGQTVRGVVTIRVRVSNAAKLRQVDFYRLSSRCPTVATKQYIGMDETPSTTGVYEISFDTRVMSNGCLGFGAAGLDRDNPKILYPTEGTYVPITVHD